MVKQVEEELGELEEDKEVEDEDEEKADFLEAHVYIHIPL